MADCTGAFPATGILDDFPVDGGPPPPGNWSTPGGGVGGLSVLGGVLVPPAESGAGVAYWNTIQTADCEDYITITKVTDDGGSINVALRADATNPGGITQAYGVSIFRDDAGGDYVNVSGVPEPPIYPIANFGVGDKIGIRVCGSTITTWYCPAGGAWVNTHTVIDALVSGPGYATISIAGYGECDDFGGGDCDCGGTPPEPVVTPAAVTTHCSEDPILALVCANGDRLDLITWEAGFELDDSWRPQVAQFKGGGSYANSQIAEGQTLVAGEYDNVVETVPLIARGTSEAACIQTYRRLQQFIKRASDYWKEPSEYDCVWLEVRPTGLGCRTGYARVVKASCADFANPYGQPFASQQAYSVSDGLSLVVEREPLWRAVPPGEIIGPLYNLLKNPDFEDWNSGVADSQPDCWDDLEVGGITGTNARDTTAPKWGKAALTVDVTNSTGAGQAKGVTQVAEGTEDGQTYTFVGWVRNAGVTSGVGRILITSLLGQYEAYRKATRHGWEIATYVFTAGAGDVIGVNCEILSTAAGTDGTVYFDSLMLLKGDWEEEAIAEVLPYMTSSHIVNHWDTGAGHLNYLDAWEVPGDADALVRLEFVNDTTPANVNLQVERYADLRIGQRRTKDVQNLQNYYDPGVIPDATASRGLRLNFTPGVTWQDVLTYTILGGANTQDNQGRYRAYMRMWDAKATGDPTLEARIRYFIGTAGANDKLLSYEQIPIRANWSMLNLTTNAAAILERKFQSQYPSQLGATLQLRRPTGSGDAYLDYLLFLPTDGGILLANLEPSLTYRRALVIDNTHSSTISSSYIKEHPWRLDWQVEVGSTEYIQSLCPFNGSLYATISDATANIFQIWRRAIGAWQKVFEQAVYNQGESSVVYNNRLYIGMRPPGAAAAFLISSADGLSWSVSHTTVSGSNFIQDQVVFEDKIFLVMSHTAGHSYIETYDGTVGAIELDTTGFLYSIGIYGGALHVIYSSGGIDYLLKRVSAGNWITVATNPGPQRWSLTYARRLEVFKGRLFIPSNSPATTTDIIGSVWDGGALTTLRAPISSVNPINYAFRAYNNQLYAIMKDVKTFVSLDGFVWEESESELPATPSAGQFWVSEVFDGELYIGGFLIASPILASAYVYNYANINESYSMANYTGGAFTAPNRRLLDDERRHRWVFSYDREGYVNVISDKALVGIGYVPRYLSLLGEG